MAIIFEVFSVWKFRVEEKFDWKNYRFLCFRWFRDYRQAVIEKEIVFIIFFQSRECICTVHFCSLIYPLFGCGMEKCVFHCLIMIPLGDVMYAVIWCRNALTCNFYIHRLKILLVLYFSGFIINNFIVINI